MSHDVYYQFPATPGQARRAGARGGQATARHRRERREAPLRRDRNRRRERPCSSLSRQPPPRSCGSMRSIPGCAARKSASGTVRIARRNGVLPRTVVDLGAAFSQNHPRRPRAARKTTPSNAIQSVPSCLAAAQKRAARARRSRVCDEFAS